LTPEAFGAISVFVALLAYPPYLKSVFQKRTKPHVFSWLIWSLLAWIAFAIQVIAGAGPGAWASGFSAFCTTAITVASLWHGEKNVTWSDWSIFIAGLLAIPLWIMTKDPTASAILVTAIYSSGFYTTFRKTWRKPQEELAATYILNAIKQALSLFALTTVNIPTALYPSALLLMNTLLVFMLAWRRYRVKAVR
jgi:hypothetical protein